MNGMLHFGLKGLLDLRSSGNLAGFGTSKKRLEEGTFAACASCMRADAHLCLVFGWRPHLPGCSWQSPVAPTFGIPQPAWQCHWLGAGQAGHGK